MKIKERVITILEIILSNMYNIHSDDTGSFDRNITKQLFLRFDESVENSLRIQRPSSGSVGWHVDLLFVQSDLGLVSQCPS